MNLAQHIMSVVPNDRVFGIDAVHELVHSATEKRYKRESIRAVLFRLYKAGELRRIPTGNSLTQVRYCRPECDAPADPNSLRDWAAVIQSEFDRPLQPAEIMVRMIERGYEPQVEPAEAVKHLRWVLPR